MTPHGEQPTVEQLRENLELLRGELAQLAGQLARLDNPHRNPRPGPG